MSSKNFSSLYSSNLFQTYTHFYNFVIKDESVLWNLKLALEYKKIKREEKLKLINKYFSDETFKRIK